MFLKSANNFWYFKSFLGDFGGLFSSKPKTRFKTIHFAIHAIYDVRFSKQEIQLLFALRSKMIKVKRNFRNLLNNNLKWQTCDDKTAIEDENHVLNCLDLKTNESLVINFDDDYGSVDDQLKAVKIFKPVLQRR